MYTLALGNVPHLRYYNQQHPRLSPFPTQDRQTLTNITGLVTTKGIIFWPADANTDRQTTSTGAMVYSISSIDLGSIRVGGLVTLSAKVSEYWSASLPNGPHLTELTSLTKTTVLTFGNPMFSLDSGKDGFSFVPVDQSPQDGQIASYNRISTILISGFGEAGVRPASTVAGDCQSTSDGNPEAITWEGCLTGPRTLQWRSAMPAATS
ncbi:hypothetical protein BDM02DRAFT_3126873 [Thelephora ganbajun]|uniref:Uncharacterized protein n=1 Tax=Thelephora ganbajun TaxID=370292 RepID=A0ACB6ZPQ6_THEGA|nr:hypothetical protein BDM02DRAFT_3126873 [Thelephora ganbajun]